MNPETFLRLSGSGLKFLKPLSFLIFDFILLLDKKMVEENGSIVSSCCFKMNIKNLQDFRIRVPFLFGSSKSFHPTPNLYVNQ